MPAARNLPFEAPGEKLRIDPQPGLDKNLIQEELRRILDAPSFRSSKRCSEFLSFVVGETLEGRQEELKERTLGVILFGRPASYDTPADPIVRVKANDVRKRLAQYYDNHTGGALRIDLAPGSYVPAFRLPDAVLPATPSGPSGEVQELHPIEERKPRRWRWIILGLATAALLLIGARLSAWSRQSPLDSFWDTALVSGQTPILCVGSSARVWVLTDGLSTALAETLAQEQPARIAIDPHQAIASANGYFSLGSVKAALGVSAFLAAKGLQPQLRMSSPLSLDDFHNHTIIAIGGFSNPWTLQRVSEMRFSFNRETINGIAWLEVTDSQNPNARWRVQESPFATPSVDYAIVTRILDPSTHTAFISLAGLNQFGTEAAAEFVTTPEYWRDAMRQLPANSQAKNLQVVIQTSVVESRPTPPKILAVQSW